jgi:alkanesulfonate monooxygenase
LVRRPFDLHVVHRAYAGYLRALDSTLDHDQRYDHLVEYGRILLDLLGSAGPFSHDGQHYRIREAALSLPWDPALTPRVFVAGSSPACLRAQERLGAVRLAYPHWIEDYEEGSDALAGTGIRLGILARDTAEDAWREAHRRFPPDPNGERIHDAAARMAQSFWHKRLSSSARADSIPRDTYWLYPFRTYKTYCPYLVGTYQQVADLLCRYLALGVRTLILDEPMEEDDMHHATAAIRLAEQRAQSAGLPDALSLGRREPICGQGAG